MQIQGWIGFAWSMYLSVPTCFHLCSAAGLKVISPLFFSLSSSWANTCQTWHCIKILMTYIKCSLEVWLAAQIRSQVFIYEPLHKPSPATPVLPQSLEHSQHWDFFIWGPDFLPGPCYSLSQEIDSDLASLTVIWSSVLCVTRLLVHSLFLLMSFYWLLTMCVAPC